MRFPVPAALLILVAAPWVVPWVVPWVRPWAVPRADAADNKEVRKEFRAAQKSTDWRERREAYYTLSEYSSAEAVQDVLDAMARETNPAVVLTGIRTLAALKSLDAQEALATVMKKGRGTRKMYVLLALEQQKGRRVQAILLETIQGKDAASSAQAALALGRQGVREALPHLLTMLKDKRWQLRAAAARALRLLATPTPPPPKPGEEQKPPVKLPVPAWMKAPDIGRALVASLAASAGRERGDIVSALEAVSEKAYGYNIDAWKSWLAGEEPSDAILAKRIWPPHIFGIPIYGRRVVLVLDNSVRTGDPHNFGSGDRMLELCEVPGGPAILAMRLRTVKQFAAAHFKRCIRDFTKGTRFELIVFNAVVRPTFGKLTSVNGGTRKLANATIDALKEDNGIATFGALTHALDIAGPTESAAWSKGPDEIVFMSCNQPTEGEIKDPDVVAAAIALKARLRLVPIHTIGILTHSYGMMETIAVETGGIYLNLYK